MSIQIRESGNHVYQHVGPWAFQNSIRVEWRCLGLCAQLCSLTNFTPLDIGVDHLLHLGPPVFSEDQFLSLLDAQVSG